MNRRSFIAALAAVPVVGFHERRRPKFITHVSFYEAFPNFLYDIPEFTSAPRELKNGKWVVTITETIKLKDRHHA